MRDRLYSISIASPCAADWNQMTGDLKTRHCNECDLNVYNLSEMDMVEIDELLAKRDERMCVRFYHRKDGTVLLQNCPANLKVTMHRLSRLARIALSTVLSASPLVAQSAAPLMAQVAPADQGIELSVVDTRGKACANALVELTDIHNAVVKGTTDSKGILRLPALTPGLYQLTVALAGFQTHHQKVWINPRATLVLQTAAGPANPPRVNPSVEEPPLIDNRASAVKETFSSVNLATGGAIIRENSPVQEPPGVPRPETRPPHSQMKGETSLELEVIDQQGAACAKASVRLTHKNSQAVTSATTNDEGRVRLNNLLPGTYSLTVALPNFEAYQRVVRIDPQTHTAVQAIMQVMQQMQGEVTRVSVDPIPTIQDVQTMQFEPTPASPAGPRKQGFFRRALARLFHGSN